MKKLITALILSLAAVVVTAETYTAEPLQNIIVNDDKSVMIKLEDWLLVWGDDSYEVYVSNNAQFSGNVNDSRLLPVQSLLIFNEPHYYREINIKTKYIYSYGLMLCNKKVVYVDGEMFINEQGILDFTSLFEHLTYAVEVSTPDTARNAIYNAVCDGR